ncbi:MAG: metallophosphoesterase family protein [Verrucomicrobiota bacterium]
MRYAIVSDIHANLRAWEAVYSDISERNVDDIICLGDIVGYGPLPAETLESVYERVEHIVLGNHDAVVAGKFDPSEFNDNARAIIEWTSEQMTEVAAEVFSEMPVELEGEDFLVSHAEVLDPERFNYIEGSEEAQESFDACESPLIFVGHTHEPAVFLMDHEKGRVMVAEPFNVRLRDNYRYIINVGSVGDPRDDDIRSCYCIYDTDLRQVFYHRVQFDVEAYRQDLEESGLMIKPDFLKRYDGEEGEETAIHDWAVRQPVHPQIIRTRPKRIITVSYGEVSSEEETQAEFEREEKERKKKLLREAAEKKKKLLDAQAAVRREREQRAREQREAMHRKMQLLQKASLRRAEEERRRKEDEEQEKVTRKTEAAMKMKQSHRKTMEERKRRKEEQRRKASEQMKRAKKIAASREKIATGTDSNDNRIVSGTAKQQKKKSPKQAGLKSDEARELEDLKCRLEQQKARQKEKKARRKKRRQAVMSGLQKIKDKVAGSQDNDNSS